MYADLVNKAYKENKEIYIFGAGKVGHIIVEYFIINYPDFKLKGVLTTNIEKNPFYIQNIDVMDIKDIKDKDKVIVLVGLMEENQKGIRELLRGQGFEEVVLINNDTIQSFEEENSKLRSSNYRYNYFNRYVRPYMNTLNEIESYNGKSYDEIKRIYHEKKIDLYNEEKLDIARLVVILGTKCSLKCRDCNNLMPLFKPQKDLNPDKIILSLERILDITTSLLKCELIGGEPFVSNNLEKVLPFVLKEDKISVVEITTNAKQIPDKQLLDLLKHKKVIIRISNYGNVVDQSEFIEFCIDNNLNHEVLCCEHWISPGDVNKRNKSIKELKEEYYRCSTGYLCKTLYEDKIFSCARSASLYNLGLMEEIEYIEVNEGLDEKKVKNFIIQDYSIACDYCDMGLIERVRVESAVQL